MAAHSDGNVPQDDGIVVKSLQLRDIDDVQDIEEELNKGKTVIILRVTPLAQKNLEELRMAVERLYASATAVGGDIVRLGDERIVITPSGVRIWREQKL